MFGSKYLRVCVAFPMHPFMILYQYIIFTHSTHCWIQILIYCNYQILLTKCLLICWLLSIFPAAQNFVRFIADSYGCVQVFRKVFFVTTGSTSSPQLLSRLMLRHLLKKPLSVPSRLGSLRLDVCVFTTNRIQTFSSLRSRSSFAVCPYFIVVSNISNPWGFVSFQTLRFQRQTKMFATPWKILSSTVVDASGPIRSTLLGLSFFHFNLYHIEVIKLDENAFQWFSATGAVTCNASHSPLYGGITFSYGNANSLPLCRLF